MCYRIKDRIAEEYVAFSYEERMIKLKDHKHCDNTEKDLVLGSLCSVSWSP